MKKNVIKISQLFAVLVFVGLQAIISVHADSYGEEVVFQVENDESNTEVIIESSDANHYLVSNGEEDNQVFGDNSALGFDVSFGKKLTSIIEAQYLETNNVSSDQFGGRNHTLVGELQNDDDQLDSFGLRYTF